MNYTVCVLLDQEILEQIGKKGSENSLTYYNGSHKEHTIVAITPTSIEEKFYAAAESMLVSEQIVIGTKIVDSLFGELVVAASLLGKRLILTNDSDVSKVVSGAGIKPEYSDRFDIAAKIAGLDKGAPSNTCRVDIDKSFVVTGIGTVALGIVTRGTVKVHDRLFTGDGSEVTIKSIQSRDIDVKEAHDGTRVGLALKGVKAEELKKGDLLCSSAIVPVDSLTSQIRQSAIGREELSAGKVYGFVSNFSYTNSTVVSIDGANATLRLERPIQMERGNSFLLVREKKPRIFAAGTFGQTS